MARPGSFRIPSRNRAFEAYADPRMRSARRVKRILESLRDEMSDAETVVRARRVFERPREVFRLEIECPSLGYQRTTLLDRQALDELLACEDLRGRFQLAD